MSLALWRSYFHQRRVSTGHLLVQFKSTFLTVAHRAATQLGSVLQFSVTRRLPEKCPYTVVSGLNYFEYSFDTHAPLGSLSFNTYGELSIVDWQGYNRAFIQRLWFINPNNSQQWLGEYDISAQPGYTKPNSPVLEDTARFTTYTAYGIAQGSLVLIGGESITAGQLTGPTSILASASTIYQAETEYDTASYFYRWTANGSTIVGATDARESLNFPMVGSYTLKTFAERADFTVDTMTRTIGVYIAVQFSGESVLAPYTNYNWSVSPLGGTGPHSFVWYMDGNYLQTGSSYSNAFNANEAHWFDVEVTDNLGNIGWSSFQFYTTSEGGGPVELRQDPRVPDPSRMRKLPPGMPRPPQ